MRARASLGVSFWGKKEVAVYGTFDNSTFANTVDTGQVAAQ